MLLVSPAMRPNELMRCIRRRSDLRTGPRTACVALTLGLLAVGCGRKASAQDCDFIVDRYVEVELTALQVTDPAVIAQRKEEMRRDLKDDLKACPGKRVTDAMLECVRRARTNDELDKCTRW